MKHIKPYLNAMVVGICNDNIFLEAQAEPVGGVELSLARSQLAKLATDLHRTDFVGARHGGIVGCSCGRENSGHRVRNNIIRSGQ